MVVLGIDPGSVVTGYGVVDCTRRKSRLIGCGCFRPSARLPFAERLCRICAELRDLIQSVSPDEVALEATFYGANVQTLMKMCHARGAILLTLAEARLPIFEYSPREVKQAVVGNGGASKEQVQFMVQSQFGKDAVPKTLDASDAVGVALCHLNRKRLPDTGPGEDRLDAILESLGAERGNSARFDEKLRQAGAAKGPARPGRAGRRRRE